MKIRIFRQTLRRWALLAGALCCLAAGSVRANEISSKVAIESSLETRLQSVLRKVLGTEDVLAIVNVDIRAEKETTINEILPGVPLQESARAGGLSSAQRLSISRITATLLLDENLDENAEALARKTAIDVLGFSEPRGDTLRVARMSLKNEIRPGANTTTVIPGPDNKPFWSSATLVGGLWFLLAVIALGLLFSKFLSPLLGVAREFTSMQAMASSNNQQGGPAVAQEAAVEETPESTKPSLPQSSDIDRPREPLPFDFLEERHLPMLKFLLRRAQPKTAAVIIHYLQPSLAAAVLEILKPEVRQEIVVHMSRVVQLDQANVQAIENSLRARIEYLMGGEDKLAEILDEAPLSLQEELLAAVREKDPDVGKRLDQRILRLEDLIYLSAEDMKTLCRRVPIRSLASVLRASESIKSQVLPKLTSGLGAWLTQEIELSGDLPPERLEAEQRRVLAALGQLVKEGNVKLKKEAPAQLPEQEATPENPDLINEPTPALSVEPEAPSIPADAPGPSTLASEPETPALPAETPAPPALPAENEPSQTIPPPPPSSPPSSGNA